MNKETAEQELENLLGCKISLHEENDIEDFDVNYEKLVEWCNSADKSVVLITEEIDISGIKLLYYSVDNDDQDFTAFIFLMENEDVFSYGYSGD